MEFSLCVLSAWLLAAGAVISPNFAPFVKNFGLLTDGDANLLEGAGDCDDNGIGTPYWLALEGFTKSPPHLKRGRTYTLKGEIAPGGINNTGYLGVASAPVLGMPQELLRQPDDHAAKCVVGERTELAFTFDLLWEAPPGYYPVKVQLYCVNEDKTIQILQFCRIIFGYVDVI